MRSDVEKRFNEALTDDFGKKPEILKFLKEHPRKKLCLDNLCEQIEIAERRTHQIIWNVKAYSHMIGSVARMFAKAAIGYAEEQQISSVEKIRRITESDRDAQLQGQLQEFIKEGALIDTTQTTQLGAEDGRKEIERE